MPQHSSFTPGAWKAQCDICSRIWTSDQLALTWDNYRACPTCWYPRNPQDFLRGKADKQAAPWSRPEEFAFIKPLALQVGGGSAFPNSLSTPSSANLNITTGFRVIANLGRVAWDGITGFYLVFKGNANSGAATPYSFEIFIGASTPSLAVSPTGLFSGRVFYFGTTPISLAAKTFGFLRITYQGNNGGGNSQAIFEQSVDGVTYVPLGPTQLGAINSIGVSDTPLYVGNPPPPSTPGPTIGAFQHYSVSVYDYPSLTLKASCVADDCGVAAAGDPAVTWQSVATSETWTLNGMTKCIPETLF